MSTRIERIDRIPLEIPFRDTPAEHMARELPHWRYVEVTEVELADGTIGHGETTLFYSWGETTEADVERAVGANAASLLWDDSLGPGLQIALFDAVGRSLGVPVHALLGDRVRDRAPISWWCIDMPAEDWVAEARLARERGYTNLKVKGRPWFDLRAQLEALDASLPANFSVDVDFNATLLDAERGREVVDWVSDFEQVSHLEGPLPQMDVAGTRHLTRAAELPVVVHFEPPERSTYLQADACDGFVVTGGASEIRSAAGALAESEHPCWLQLVGTGITAAFSLHFGGVVETATWPAVNCHQLFEHDLLVESIPVEEGTAPVPDAPGLGVEIDRDALDTYRVTRPETRPNPPRLIECDWPEGPTIYLAEGEINFVIEAAWDEYMPYYESGAVTRLLPDDGSDAWQSVHDRASDQPVVESAPIF